MVRRLVVLGVAAGMIMATAAGVSAASSARSRPDVTAARSSATQTVAPAGVKAAPAAAGFTSEALWSSSDDWEPNVATAPNSSYVYEVTTRYSTKFCAKGQGHCMVFRSSADGGTTWSADSVICPCKVSQNDPVMKVATDGTIYDVHMNGYAVVFQKSSDHGQTWSVPIDFKALSGLSFTDKPWIAISPSGQDVYVAFNSTGSYVSVSHDYGAHLLGACSDQQRCALLVRRGRGCRPERQRLLLRERRAGREIPDRADKARGRVLDKRRRVLDDHIRRHQPAAASLHATVCPADFFGAQAAIAVDPAGTIMVAYAKSTTAAGPMSLYEITSTNGTTWSAPTALGSGGTTVGADFPALAAGPTAGDFRVAWMDDRNGAGAFNVWYRSTTNSGGTWGSAVRLSNLGSGAPYKTAAGFAFTYGDYFSMAVNSAGKSYVIWGEGPSYRGPGGTWSASG